MQYDRSRHGVYIVLYMTAVLNKCMEVLYRWYMKSTNTAKYTVEFSHLVNLVGIRDPDLVLLLYSCVRALL